MNSRFLLPCPCGQATPIELSQAGRIVTCTCGRELAVPNLRGIRQLQPAPEAAPEGGRRGAGWNPAKGTLFALGALLALGGLIAAAYNYRIYARLSQFAPSQERFQFELDQIDDSPPAELLELWEMVNTHGIGDHESSPYVQARVASRSSFQLLVSGAVGMLVGLVLVTLSLFVPARRPTP